MTPPPLLDAGAPAASTRAAPPAPLAESPRALAYAIPFALLALVPSGEVEAGTGGPFSIHAPLLLDRALLPLVGASALVSALELTSLLAGRGRAVPAARALTWVRPLLIGALAVAALLYTLDDVSRAAHARLIDDGAAVVSAGAGLAITVLLSLAAHRAARRGRVSIVPPLLLVAAAAHGVRAASIDSPHWVGSIGGTLMALLGNGLVPVAAVMVALRWAPLREEDLRRLRVTAWTRDDLALAPLALVAVGLVIHESISRGTFVGDLAYGVAADLQELPYLGLPAAAFVCGVVFTLARWVRESDEARARRPKGAGS